MFKNMIIAVLLEVIINLQPGRWAVDGAYRTIWKIVFIAFVWFILCLWDAMIEEFKEDLK